MRDPLSSYACLSSLSMRKTSTSAEREFYTCVYEGQWLFCSKLWDIPPPRTNRRMTGSNGMYQDAVILAWVKGTDLHSELAAHWLETTLGQMWFLNCQILTILRWLADMRLVLFCYLARPPHLLLDHKLQAINLFLEHKLSILDGELWFHLKLTK